MQKLKTILVLFFVLIFFPRDAFAITQPPRNGVIQQYYGNGNPRFIGRYKNGEAILIRNYYENGKISIEYRYKGKKLYQAKTFYENGQLKSIWTSKTGLSKNYYPDGRLKSVVETKKDPQYKSSYIYSP